MDSVDNVNEKEYSKAIAAANLYGSTSFSVAFINKALMTSYVFDFPVIIMVMRMFFTVIILHVLRMLQLIQISGYTFSKGKSFAVPSMLYGLNSVLGLNALSHMNVAMFGVVKQCIPFVTMLFSVVVLKKGLPSKVTILAVIVLTFGCVLAGYGDTTFNTSAYVCGALCNITQSMYLLSVQRYSVDKGDALSMLLLNSYNTLPFLVLFSYLNSEIINVTQYEHLGNPEFIILFFLAISVGCLFNFAVFFCTKMTSALTTSIIGGMKTIAQTVIGSFNFGGISKNWETYVGISLNLLGSMLYIFEKYRTQYKTVAVKKSRILESTIKI